MELGFAWFITNNPKIEKEAKVAEIKKRKSVGLLLVIRNSEGELEAVLQRRGRYNHEKDWGRESRPGGCQVTIHGGVEDGETTMEALFREIKEELGKEFLNLVIFWEEPPRLLEGDSDVSMTYAMFVPKTALSLIRLGPSSGGIDFLKIGDVKNIKNILDFDKVIGITDYNTVAMFPDEIKAVEMALNFFEGVKRV